MLAHLKGTVAAITESAINLEVGPLGLYIQIPNPALFTAGQQTTLLTHLHWNQEQGPSLFGFATQAEKTVFLLLLDCPGVGPKIALAVLAHMAPAVFLRAVQSGNDEALSQVNGIGAKKAEQLIVHLKHKVNKLIEAGLGDEEDATANQWQTVIEALSALNYSRPEVNRALRHLHEQHADKTYAFDYLLRQALSFLAKNNSSIHSSKN